MKSAISKGEIAQLKVQMKAAEHNLACSIPTTEVRYDLIIEQDGVLYRTQIKYCDQEYLNSSNRINDHQILRLEFKNRKYTKDEIDMLLIYVPRIDEILAYNGDYFHNRKRIKIYLASEKSKHYYKNHIWLKNK